MVYAQLIHTKLTAVLNFLSSVPGPAGETALNFVMTEWVSRQHLFFGCYETKVSTIALAKILQHGVYANDSRLHGIIVKGDMIMNPSTSNIRTRAQKKSSPDEWTKIDLLSKIFKLLVNEVGNALNDVYGESDTDDEDEEDGSNNTMDDEGMEDDGTTSIENNGAVGVDLSKVIDLDYDDDENNDDPEALNDPIYKINLKQYLTDFLIDFSREPFFGHFIQHATEIEKSTLSAIGITG